MASEVVEYLSDVLDPVCGPTVTNVAVIKLFSTPGQKRLEGGR